MNMHLQMSLRAATASALSVFTAYKLGMHSPIYAVIAAVVVTDLSPQQTHRDSAHRLLGTVWGPSWAGYAIGFP